MTGSDKEIIIKKAMDCGVLPEKKEKKFSRELFAFFLISLLALGGNFFQTLFYLLSTPPQKVFSFVHNHLTDYYYYLQLMRQGFDGYFLATSYLTPENFPPQFVNPFFLFLGHFARIFSLSLPFTYTFFRLLGGGFLLLGIYFLLGQIYLSSGKRILAFFFVLFGTFFWEVKGGEIVLPPLVYHWTELDPFFRLTFVPHHLWSKVFLVFLFVFLGKERKRTAEGQNLAQKGKRMAGLIFLTLLMGLTNPVVLATFLPVFGFFLFWEVIKEARENLKISFSQGKKGKFFSLCFLVLKKRGEWLVVWLVAFLVAFYHRKVEKSVFPWTSYLTWEKVVYPVDFFSYLQALGPCFFLFLLGLFALWRKSFLGRLLVFWGLSGLPLLFLLGRFLPLTNLRFLSGYQFIPLGIGSAEGVWRLSELFSAGKKFWRKIFLLGIIGFFALYFSLGLWASLKVQIGYVFQNREDVRVYLPKTLISAFSFLEKAPGQKAVVLAPYDFSMMIPSFTGKRVVWGHPLMTNKAKEKEKELQAFFSFPQPEKNKEIWQKYGVSYLLLPKKEKPPFFPQGVDFSLFYENADYEIYQVRKN